MINKIFKYYNENRRKIWGIIGIIAFVIVIIQLLNYLVKIKNNKDQSITKNISSTDLHTKAIISGTTISEEDAIKNNNLIKEFMDNCNNGKIDDAYNLLSSDCKNCVYNSIDEFKSKYYNIKFLSKRDYKQEQWIESTSGITYMIEYSNDLLSTGKIIDSEKSFDYITIVNENDTKKLNISNFIGSVNINKVYNDDYVEVNAVSKRIYQNHEIYTFTIKNKTENNIALQSNEKTWIMKDNKDNEYYINIDSSLYNINLEKGSMIEFKAEIEKIFNPEKNVTSMEIKNLNINNRNIDIKINF